MSDAAKEAVLKEINSLRRKITRLEQDRDMYQRMTDNLDASIGIHNEDLFDLLAAYEKLGGSPDETIPG